MLYSLLIKFTSIKMAFLEIQLLMRPRNWEFETKSVWWREIRWSTGSLGSPMMDSCLRQQIRCTQPNTERVERGFHVAGRWTSSVLIKGCYANCSMQHEDFWPTVLLWNQRGLSRL